MNHPEFRRSNDTQVAVFLSKYWHIIFGVSGLILTLYSGYLTTNSNSIKIAQHDAKFTTQDIRINAIETVQSVKEFQFSEIITRLNKMENKIDTLNNRKKTYGD